MTRADRPRRAGHIIALTIFQFVLGIFGIVAAISSAGLTMFGVIAISFGQGGGGLPLVALGIASVAIAVGFAMARPWHLPMAAAFVGWAVVSMFVSITAFQSRVWGAIAMVVAALAMIADARDGRDRALRPGRPRE